MTTVFTLPGAMSLGNMATVQAAFGGPQSLLTQLGDNSTANVVGVPYNDTDTWNGSTDGATKLQTQLAAAPAGERIVVLGHSYGSVAICQWLRQYGPSSPLDPSKITFVLAANSIRPNNGFSTMLGLYTPAGPVSTKWNVIDVARQYDRWADFPNNWASAYIWHAYNVVSAGDTITNVGGIPNNIHCSYQNLNLTDPNAASVTVGTVKFMLFETPDPIPGDGPNMFGQLGASRAQLETAYKRIVPAPW